MPNPTPISSVLGSSLKKITFRFRNATDESTHKLPDTTTEVDASDDANKPLPLRRLFVPRVVIAATNYGCLALTEMSIRAVQPVFFSTPLELGGLGLAPYQIGQIFAVSGIITGFAAIIFFPKVHARFGTKRVYTAGVVTTLVTILSFPVMHHFTRAFGLHSWLARIALAIHIISSTSSGFSYGQWRL